MLALLRFGVALLVALLCLPAFSWLLLVCADFAGLEDSLAPRAGWIMFSSVSAAALVLPPALHAWPDLSRPAGVLIPEGLRASLLSFALFALVFLAGARPLFEWMKLPAPITGMVAGNLSLTFACPLVFLSYTVCRSLLPRPAPEEGTPAPMYRFGWLSLGILALLVLQPWLTGNEPLLFSSKVELLCAAWIIFALRMALHDHANAGFVPVWGALCLVLMFRLGSSLPFAQAPDLALGGVLMLLLVWSCACLLRRESRDWLC
jgi:hypothetical protein